MIYCTIDDPVNSTHAPLILLAFISLSPIVRDVLFSLSQLNPIYERLSTDSINNFSSGARVNLRLC